MEKLALFGIISIVVISFVSVVFSSAVELSTANAAFNAYHAMSQHEFSGPKVYGGAIKKFQASYNAKEIYDMNAMNSYREYLANNPDRWTCGFSQEVAEASVHPCFFNDDVDSHCCIINHG